MKKILFFVLIVLAVTVNNFTVSKAEWIETSIQSLSGGEKDGGRGIEYNNSNKTAVQSQNSNYKNNIQSSQQTIENKPQKTDIQNQTEAQSLSPMKVRDYVQTSSPSSSSSKFMYYIPASLVNQQNKSFPIIVFVPGYNGDGEASLPQSFYDFADKNGFGILTPTFISKDDELYTQMSYHYPKAWSGDALIKMLEKAKRNGLNYSKLYMVGFSAGAQFVSRFSLIHPEMIDSCAILSSGGRVKPETKNNVKYFIGIGRYDEKFRLENAQIFSNACKNLGINYTYKEYNNGHEISEQELQDVLNFIKINKS